MKTNYSDSDFQIEWKNVRRVHTSKDYYIELNLKDPLNGTLLKSKKGFTRIALVDGGITLVQLDDIVYLHVMDDSFGSRLNCDLDLGVSIAKSNNLRQFNMNSTILYLEKKWAVGLSFNALFSRQDSIRDINRGNLGLAFRYTISRYWIALVYPTLSRNSEQALKLRLNSKFGGGRYILDSNRITFIFLTGVANNQETYYDPEQGLDAVTDELNNWEVFLGTDVSIFDIGDLDFDVKMLVYPSITQRSRWRVDLASDFKYNNIIVKDLYVKFNFSLNFDNQPTVEGGRLDYALTVGLGWTFN